MHDLAAGLCMQDSPISDPNWPVDHALFLACAADTIRRVRNHPCIALWCGGNEQVRPDLASADLSMF